ncbi:tyrosine-type recombinase/integrase [Streptacidiphilus sp. PAMC 29251]
MSRVWIEDRINQADYKQAVQRAKSSSRTPPGRFRVRWYDPDGKPRSLTYLKKIDAEHKRAELQIKLGDGSYSDPGAGRTKLAEVAESWFASKVDLKVSTRNRYRELLDLYILPRWGTTAVARIRFEDIVTWMGDLLADTVKSGRPMSPASLRKIHIVLRAVLGFAMRSKKIATNPAVGIPLPRLVAPEHIYLNHMQVEDLADACGPYRTFVLFLAYTGVRWGEASAIRVGRVDLKARRVRIAEAWSTDKSTLVMGTPKTHERRTVPIPPFLAKDLAALMEDRGPEEFLFTAEKGGVLLNRNFVRRIFAPGLATAGLTELGVTPHVLRHTAASLAIASGADVKVVQTMLGHKSATLTLDTYGHLWPDRLDEVSDRLDLERTKALAKARKKAEKAVRKAQELAAELAALEATEVPLAA